VKQITYDNKVFLELFKGVAIRPHTKNRIEVLTHEVNGEVMCVSSSDQRLYKPLKSIFKARGLA
jgi:hypothetical protein